MSSLPSHRWGTAPGFVGPRHRLRERLLLRLFLEGDPGLCVLNAGAGQGSLTGLLTERGFTVTSVDVSAAAVAGLRETVGGDVLQADLLDLPFPDQSFDAVVAGEVLEHLDDDVAGLREAARVVRPGGVVAVSVPAGPHRYGPSDAWAGHRRRYDRAALERLFAESGLYLEKCAGWGFPLSAFYHRHLYERRLQKLGASPATGGGRALLALLGLVLQLDRLFVGVDQGALGYLARARKHL